MSTTSNHRKATAQVLATRRVPEGVGYAAFELPLGSALSPDAPALSAMTDFAAVGAATVHPLASIEQAERTMRHHGVQCLLVVSDPPRVEGLLSQSDLQSDKLLRMMYLRGMQHDGLVVADMMSPVGSREAVDHAALAAASVGQLVLALQGSGCAHLLVTETSADGGLTRLRGIVSLAQLEHRLGAPLSSACVVSDPDTTGSRGDVAGA
jgi:CBS-domain-containing membrane protein